MSTFRLQGGAYSHAQGTRDAFGRLSDRLVSEGHPGMTSISGDREPETQLAIWYQRMTLNPGNRRVYGTATWQGRKWYRVHPDAVGVPGSSNHEKRRSHDLAWPYNSDTVAHRRAKQLAPSYNITCEGEGFGEKWHWTFWGALGAIGAPASSGAAAAAVVTYLEDDMATLVTGGGQSLIVGNKLIGFGTAEDVKAVKGAQVLEVSAATHYQIIQAFQRDGGSGLPVRVFVSGGNGTVYLMTEGKLAPLVDPNTLRELDAKGGPAITLSQAEVENLLKAG